MACRSLHSFRKCATYGHIAAAAEGEAEGEAVVGVCVGYVGSYCLVDRE
jgi:hypothetical protein